MSEVNGNGAFSQKEMLIELRGMLSTHIEESAKAHAAFMAQMSEIAQRQAMHEADSHAVTVKRLEDESIREAGRRDVLKYIFGTSVVALLTGIGGLVLGVVRLLGGAQ